MIKSNTVISVENLSKKFCRNLRYSIIYGFKDAIKDMLGFSSKRDQIRPEEFWALDNISFSIQKGDVVGILGRNGAGKSTLLRILCGIYPPDIGTVAINGKIGALIALGAGFHPDMSGRDNIFLNASLMGARRSDVQSKLDEIISFAEIGEFIDSAVSTYSSGMTIRLGFSIAIHCAPDVIIADEVLAVGDLQFALKCYRKISEYRSQGGTILLVSHSIQQVRNFCNSAIWLENGTVRHIGNSQDVCDAYEKYMFEKDEVQESLEINGSQKSNVLNYDSATRITLFEHLDKDLSRSNTFRSGEKIIIRAHFNCTRDVIDPVFTISIFNAENIQIISNYTSFDSFRINSISGTGFVQFEMQDIHLKPGRYKCMLTFAEYNDVNKVLEWHEKGYPFTIEPGFTAFFGIINPEPIWSLWEEASSANHPTVRV
jgi:lipopolysaccharide transport system ATP-binding protein